MDIICPGCQAELELEGTPAFEVMDCPACGTEIKLVQEAAPVPKRKKPVGKKKLKRQQAGFSKRASAVRRRDGLVEPDPKAKPKTLLLRMWIMSTVAFMALMAFCCFIDFRKTDGQNLTFGVNGFSIFMLCVILPIGAYFFSIAYGLQKRSAWGWKHGMKFTFINFVSPLLPLAYICMKKLDHDETRAAFGIPNDL